MKEIFIRTSIRKFKADKITQDQLDSLMRAAMAAPTAANQQDWEFILVDDPQVLQRLEASSPYASALKSAPLAIVIVADNTSRLHEYWQQDCAAAAENILLEAVSLGLGGVWMGVAPSKVRMDKITEILSLPGHIDPFCILAIGVPETQPKQTDRYNLDKIHHNQY